MVFLFNTIHLLYAQNQEQELTDPYYYQIKGLVYVREYNTIAPGTRTRIEKIPKENLKFRIVRKETDNTNNSTFYIIQFLPIKPSSDDLVQTTVNKLGMFRKTTTTNVTSTLKGNTTFVNSADNNKYFWLRKDEFDNYIQNQFIIKSYLIPNVGAAYGANISLPFKLRAQTQGQNIKITPDLTLGGYLGLKMRLSRTRPFYVTVPVVSIGLATLSINDNSITTSPAKGDGTVLGITGCTGIVFQLDDFQFGLMVGIDRAAGEIGKDWIYNNKLWSSFSIGYTFLRKKDPR